MEIDGSQKSGSGTIVRFSLGLAILLGQPLHLTNIRAKREKPGLRPQHLQAIKALQQMCRGGLEGGQAGSREIWFRPGKEINGGYYQWDIGTAGSTTLLVMTLLPACLLAKEPVSINVSGGLFQDFAPSAYHLKHVLLPILRGMGINVELAIVRPGYVPRGGGIIEVRVEPVKGKLGPVRLAQPGRVTEIRGVALSSHLSERRVSERMAERCNEVLQSHGLKAEIEIVHDDLALQRGAALALYARTSTGGIIGADRAGAPGRSSEEIGEYVATSLIEDLASGASVDRHLADQLVLYAALAEGTSQYRIPQLSEHLETNLWLVETVLGAKTEVRENTVKIEGVGYTPRPAIQPS